MGVDFRRNKPPPSPVPISGTDVELVQTYRCLGIHLDNKLEWSSKTEVVYMKGLRQLYFLQSPRSFHV